MALDKITSQSLEVGAVTLTALPDGVISAAKLHTTAISDKLGYTPVSPTDLSVKADITTVNDALALKAPQSTTYTKTEVDTFLAGKTNVNSLTTSWTIQETAGVIYFKYNGVNKAKLDSSGNLTVVGNVTAYGTV